MPIYDYVCKHCGHYAEDEFAQPGESLPCPICKEDMQQQMPEIMFKIGNSMALKHKRKYGNNHEAVPKSKTNGVNIYGTKKSKK